MKECNDKESKRTLLLLKSIFQTWLQLLEQFLQICICLHIPYSKVHALCSAPPPPPTMHTSSSRGSHLITDAFIQCKILPGGTIINAYKSKNTNAILMAFTPSLALDPTFGIHSCKTLDTAQPCNFLKPNWKPSSSYSIFIPTNISTQFLLQSVCARACVCVRVHVRVCV